MTRLALWRLGFTFESPFFLLSREELFQEEQEEKLKVKQKQPKRGVKACCICCSFCSFLSSHFFYFMLGHVPVTQDVLEEIYGTDGLEDQLHPKFSETNFDRGFSGFSGFSWNLALFFGFHFFFQVWFPHQTRLWIPERWDWELSRWLLMPEANSVISQKMGRIYSISQKVLCFNNLQFCSSSSFHPKLFVFEIRI